MRRWGTCLERVGVPDYVLLVALAFTAVVAWG